MNIVVVTERRWLKERGFVYLQLHIRSGSGGVRGDAAQGGCLEAPDE